MKPSTMTKLNRQLSLVLLAMIAIYILAAVFHVSGRESNTTAFSFHTDTAGVSTIALYPERAGHQEIKLVRHDGRWQILSGSHQATPQAGAVGSLLNALTTINTQRLVSSQKNKWDQYKVGDTTGTRIVVYNNNTPVADYRIGQTQNTGAGPYGGDNIAYIRAAGHNEVYAVDGYLHSLTDKTFADWRDKTFLRLNRDDITAISFQGDQGFALTKKDSTWSIGPARAASDSVRRYIDGLQYRTIDQFADDFHPAGPPDRSIVFSQSSGPLATIKAWRQPDGSWALQSTLNPDSYFSVSDSVMKKDLWRATKDLVP